MIKASLQDREAKSHHFKTSSSVGGCALTPCRAPTVFGTVFNHWKNTTLFRVCQALFHPFSSASK